MNNLSNQNELTPELIREYNEEKSKASFQIDTFSAFSDNLATRSRAPPIQFHLITYQRLIKKFCEDEILAKRLLIISKKIFLARPSQQPNQKNLLMLLSHSFMKQNISLNRARQTFRMINLSVYDMPSLRI